MFDLRKGGIVAAVILALLVVGLRTLIPRIQPIEHPSLAAIHWQTEEYVGRRVELRGVVRAFDDQAGRYYVLEDDNQNRILLRSASPLILQRVNRPLVATGTVGFDDRQGIYLDVEGVRVPGGS